MSSKNYQSTGEVVTTVEQTEVQWDDLVDGGDFAADAGQTWEVAIEPSVFAILDDGSDEAGRHALVSLLEALAQARAADPSTTRVQVTTQSKTLTAQVMPFDHPELLVAITTSPEMANHIKS